MTQEIMLAGLVLMGLGAAGDLGSRAYLNWQSQRNPGAAIFIASDGIEVMQLYPDRAVVYGKEVPKDERVAKVWDAMQYWTKSHMATKSMHSEGGLISQTPENNRGEGGSFGSGQ